ncbi:hypothetical protein CRENBAI_023575 [Crenichthys baileyi]|uniref:Uncharacterized protein n=1 Tax=Crenichthys baileyi TaxID=28760 RepID=A0AAV9QU28_9TELE
MDWRWTQNKLCISSPSRLAARRQSRAVFLLIQRASIFIWGDVRAAVTEARWRLFLGNKNKAGGVSPSWSPLLVENVTHDCRQLAGTAPQKPAS